MQPTRWSDIKLSRIDSFCSNTDDYLDDVLVVWTATKPIEGGTFIVGWYKHARVYRAFQNNAKSKERNGYDYNIEAKSSDCTLLIEKERTMKVPRAKASMNKGFMGQSNIWYADSDIKEVKNFRQSIFDYIENYVKPQRHKAKPKIDVDAKVAVEKAAVSAVTSYYTGQGYNVISVEDENKGWDLEATKGKAFFRIEVKGLVGSQISVHISKNEYAKMKASDNADYRLCVVTNTLKSPEIWTFSYDNGIWVCEEDNDIELSFEEQIAAIAYVE